MLLSRLISYSIPFNQFCHLKMYTKIICDCLCMFSGVMVTLIALDRYIHMRFLNRYSAWMTSKRAIMLVIFNGCLCSFVAAVQILAYTRNLYSSVLLVMNSVAIFLIVSTSIAYFYAYRSLNTRTKQLDFERSAPGPATTARRKRNPTKEFLKAMIAVLSTLIFCFTPYVIASALAYVYRNTQMSEAKGVIIFFYISRCFVCMNSSLNATLFMALNKELRVYVLRVISFGHLEEGSSTAVPHDKPGYVSFDRSMQPTTSGIQPKFIERVDQNNA